MLPFRNPALDGIERVIDAWQGLTMNEGVVASAMKQSVMEGIDEGVLIGETWLEGDDSDALVSAMENVGGSGEERLLAAEILRLAIAEPHEDSIGLGIGNKRKSRATRRTVHSSDEIGLVRRCSHGFWATHGWEALAVLGLEGEDAKTIWEEQRDAPKPFGKFLKGLDQAKALAQQKARFPPRKTQGLRPA